MSAMKMTLYTQPRPGTIFQKEEQDGRWEYGQITGLRVTETKDAEGKLRESYWIAHLTNGWVDFRDAIRSDTTFSSTEDWHPVPVEETKAPEAPPAPARPSRASAAG